MTTIQKKRYLIAKSPWSAKQILIQVDKGKVEPDQVLFKSVHQAQQRIKKMPRNSQSKFSIYGTDVRFTP